MCDNSKCDGCDKKMFSFKRFVVETSGRREAVKEVLMEAINENGCLGR